MPGGTPSAARYRAWGNARVAPGSGGLVTASVRRQLAWRACRGHQLYVLPWRVAVASLNTRAEAGSIDTGDRADQVGAPPLTGSNTPLLIVSETDNSVRPLDANTQVVGAPVRVGAGPQAESFARGRAMLAPQQVSSANAGDGTISVLDENATSVQSTLRIGGRPVGVVPTIDGRVWVADADSGRVSGLDPAGGEVLQTIAVGPRLTGLRRRQTAITRRFPQRAGARAVRGGPARGNGRSRG